MNDPAENLIGRRIQVTEGEFVYAPKGSTGTIVAPPGFLFRAKPDKPDVDQDGDYWADMDHAPLGDSPVCVGRADRFELLAEETA